MPLDPFGHLYYNINMMITLKGQAVNAGSCKRVLATLLFFVMALGVYAQNYAPAGDSFYPYVSQLTAETRNNLARLTWVDSQDARGPVYIFRSTRPFAGVVPPEMRPTMVSYGTQAYVDESEGSGTVYYFVAASDAQGRRYDIFIPYTNTATAVFSPAAWGDASPAYQGTPQIKTPVPAPETKYLDDAAIANLSAGSQGEGVIITFAASGIAKKNVLYRSTQPILRVQDLLYSVIIQTGISSPFIDYPAPGASYYYALVFEDDISRGVLEIQPGKNATTTAVVIAAKPQENTPPIRAMPLPSLSVYKTSPSGDSFSGLPSPVAAPSKPIGNLEITRREQSAPLQTKRPRVFARDLEAPGGGEDSILRVIVQGPFAQREWPSAREKLLQFLSIPRSKASEARARFYLGQAYYFSGKNREALLEFLAVQSTYPNEANEWIEAVLATMK